MFDKDSSNSIDIDEFAWVLVSGPSCCSGPRSASSGVLLGLSCLGRVTGTAQEYLGIEVTEQTLEKMFRKYDADNSGSIRYHEFKRAWAQLSDVRQELINRGITDFPKWAPRPVLVKLLEAAIDEEEVMEVSRASAVASELHAAL
jgi:hypothetical protein